MVELDFNEYLDAFNKFKKKDWVFESLRSPNDIIQGKRNGKVIIFPMRKGSGPTIVFIGAFVLVVGIIIMIALGDIMTMDIMLIFTAVFAAFSMVFILSGIIGISRAGKAFLAVNPKGFVYKAKSGKMIGYPWDQVEIKFFMRHTKVYVLGTNVSTSDTPEPHIILPSEKTLEIKVGDYEWNEFPSWKVIGEENLYYLFALIFKIYPE
ncbi:MAG: hypothetical protein ACFFCS_28055 [Candidatus Hodarchaeota archaeon]